MMFMPHLVYDYSNISQVYRGLLYARSPQGKVAELRLELQTGGGKKDKMHMGKKIALKKIVANMTMSNNDMVALFPDVIACMNIPSLEIKKMSVPIGKVVARKIANAIQVLSIPCQLCSVKTRDRAEGATCAGTRYGGL